MSTVMIVDDSPSDRRLLSRLIGAQGFETVCAADGREAVALLEAGRLPDLIVLDVLLPHLDGVGVLEMLHEHPQWKMLPVIMITGVADTHCVRRCEQLGAKAYLVKATFSVAQMLEEVKRYAGRSGSTVATEAQRHNPPDCAVSP